MTGNDIDPFKIISERTRAAAAREALLEAERVELETLPSVSELCLERPLYMALETKNSLYLAKIRGESAQFDAFCIWCDAPSIFKDQRSRGGGAGTSTPADWMLKPGYFDVEVKCARAEHTYLFCFVYMGGRLTKYGQMPSLEDIAGHNIRKYAPLLRDGYFGELKRATGLASHGIGIGSFVYLRRIFEKLIHDHHAELAGSGNAIEGFETLRMDEKIGALKDVLPPALVRNKATYGILSSGLHALDEVACRRYFPVVRAAIIEILEQDLRAREQAKATAALEKEVAKLANEVKTGSTTLP
jgi:hypothetical protein